MRKHPLHEAADFHGETQGKIYVNQWLDTANANEYLEELNCEFKKIAKEILFVKELIEKGKQARQRKKS